MIEKARFIEPGHRIQYKSSLINAFVIGKAIKNPATGLITLATIVKSMVDDTLMYSESISEVDFEDIYHSDVVFITINTYNALRGYEIAGMIRRNSNALVVFGGLHASLNYAEAVDHCDYILTGEGDESIVEFIHAINSNRPVDFEGVVFRKDGMVIHTGERQKPTNIDTIPDRSLVHKYAEAAKRHDKLWPQVHASRGCPHTCTYCPVIKHFGRKVRKRSPENVVEDIKQAIAFYRRRVIPRLTNVLWFTDDNFFHDRKWAISVLKEIIEHKIKCRFSVQARFEIGFDDELLALMKEAGFFEVALGIEFVHDNNFKQYKKNGGTLKIAAAIRKIRAHGIGVRGLFIVGADNDTKGIGKQIVEFVTENEIHGVFIQSLYFTPGTDFFEQNKHRLIHRDWSRYDGRVVHYPKNIKPHELQQEIIYASSKIYSIPRLLHAISAYKGLNRVLLFGEIPWQAHIRKELRKDLGYLKGIAPPTMG